ncbi:6-carboxytetrahydropterin synthase QueD [Endomicrobium proavitum]|uniref:6-carboxy-5,6,7,8-tetrahydropterin synthase n=1 Tax=Endomicrobium proavitum TaxID=1408281 RepID=A0A0G3WIR0_9BACT|nr:6-carboxytetrahydropterin synthase QueD [Endomicrobium proavitum]AKL97384.1 6-pyruvoyl tetrahydrobiopterin synthase [Endomicrobium proavitum]
MKYKLSVTKGFASAHCLREYKGKCENVHGHNWKIRAAFGGTQLDKTGMLIDFTDLKAHLDKIMTYLDHKFLNETAPFDKINPTAENIALYIFEELKKAETLTAKVAEVEVWESDTSSATITAE